MADIEPSTFSFSVPPYFLYGAATGFLIVVVFFHLCRDVLVPKFATDDFKGRIAKLSRKDANFFYVTVPSMIHSLVHSFFHPAWISLGLSAEHSANRVTYFDETWPAYFSGIFVGYLVADFIVLGPKDLGPMYIVHHLSASSIWTYSTCNQSMQWYGSFLQFCEFSTIFLNIRQWILTAGYPSSSTIASMASLSFFLSFFAVRVVPLPKLVYNWVTEDFQKLSKERTTALAVANSVTLIIHVALQTFWFGLMVQKLVSVVTGKKKKPASSKSTEEETTKKES